MRAVLGSLVRQTQGRLRHRDVVVLATSLTFFGVVAVIPLLLVAVALTTALTSAEQVSDLAERLGDALPTTLGAQAVLDVLVPTALDMRAREVLLALVPITVYGEGLRRVLLRLQGPRASGGRDSGTSWRGRLAILPLVALTPALLMPLLLAAGSVADLQDRGGVGSTILAAVVGYYALLLVLLVPVAWTFRVVAAGHVRCAALGVGSFLTAASLSGFLQGFVLFLALPLPLGAPFGGLTAVGGVITAAVWLLLLHLVLLTGWAITLVVQQHWSTVRDRGAVDG